MDSLIQQRLAFERDRTFGWLAVVFGALFFAWGAWMAWSGTPTYLFGAAACAVGIVLGVQRIRRSGRTREVFEREHGKHAGVRS
ncbi:hypothetical protein [Plantibacter flavus]|uniref:hypothetical protein n=1 Tax=Plantibacter flavus TaxID=150123 RepID=UPI000A1CE421|nr:hypothetical protein [Plantibacter flavus]